MDSVEQENFIVMLNPSGVLGAQFILLTHLVSVVMVTSQSQSEISHMVLLPTVTQLLITPLVTQHSITLVYVPVQHVQIHSCAALNTGIAERGPLIAMRNRHGLRNAILHTLQFHHPLKSLKRQLDALDRHAQTQVCAEVDGDFVESDLFIATIYQLGTQLVASFHFRLRMPQPLT